ncbi:MAG: putative metal-binding motif-containing protein [bacterium]
MHRGLLLGALALVGCVEADGLEEGLLGRVERLADAARPGGQASKDAAPPDRPRDGWVRRDRGIVDPPAPDAEAPDPPDAQVCRDGDGDGRGPGCAAGLDCDDRDPQVHEGAVERCNDADDDCDGQTDEGPRTAASRGRRGPAGWTWASAPRASSSAPWI